VRQITPPAAAPLPGGEPAVASPEPAGNRWQRKKRRTRDVLIEAAAARGYDHTAVHEITDAVDVSERYVAKRLSTPAAITGG